MARGLDIRLTTKPPEQLNGQRQRAADGFCHFFNTPRGFPRGEDCPFIHAHPDEIDALQQHPKRPEPTPEEEASRQVARGKYNA